MSRIVNIVVAFPQKVVERRRGAVMLPAGRTDQFEASGTWHTVGDFSRWQYGDLVDSVSIHGGRLIVAVDDILALHGFDDAIAGYVEVKAIKKIVPSEITEEDRALMYDSHDEWLEMTNGGLPGRKGAWLFIVETLDTDIEADQPAGEVIVNVDVLKNE